MIILENLKKVDSLLIRECCHSLFLILDCFPRFFLQMFALLGHWPCWICHGSLPSTLLWKKVGVMSSGLRFAKFLSFNQQGL